MHHAKPLPALETITMPSKVRTTFLLIAVALLAFFHFHLRLSPPGAGALYPGFGLSNLSVSRPSEQSAAVALNYAIREAESVPSRHVSSIPEEPIDTVSILFPAWEVFAIAPPAEEDGRVRERDWHCVFQNNATSPAALAGVLPFTNRTMFKCELPPSVRRLRPFYQPALTRSSSERAFPAIATGGAAKELFRWNFLAYESLSTEDDVVLFVKGVNNRQGINRSPSELSCVFGDDPATAVRTAVMSSAQEVFRCAHPKLSAVDSGTEIKIKITLEIALENRVIPSVAYYTPERRKLATNGSRSLLCACTMVHNVAKFLKEWVMYHASIGVDRFLLYDNGSDDGLQSVVDDLNRGGYHVRMLTWLWPKTQEAGFSHSAIYANDSCEWMAYVDVDEFIFAPAWNSSALPSKLMLTSLLPAQDGPALHGQVSIKCYEFGPSNQKTHPPEGVTQGYTCRTRTEQRHKSMLRLDAAHASLLNVIHHFRLKEGYKSKQVRLEDGVVNHYKYQAWSEFKTKFRRRVSAYVVDWTQAINPASKDRAPGLGFEPVEPRGWAQRFCEVGDDRLKALTQRWFGLESGSGYTMAWQR
ncbi:glycosyltransferase family 92 protein RCOM_0530710 [Rhodamnia argentea]|uniref:Glycosyltransferase family 92 protein n=1 Tax=Rhodamnia argentea TaxID=178133 RepID=A0A8B8NJ16_9MYRT|nr:glycosyltransferase family 92 protein RCOM_0530710 [Rhodamnia argentea]